MTANETPEEDLEEFDEMEEAALDALASGSTHAEAGAVVGRSAKWVQRRLRDDRFVLEARRRRGERLDEVTHQLSALASNAVAVIGDTMTHGEDPVRLRAAIAALTLVTKIGKQADLEARIVELEQRAAAASGDRS